MSRIVKIDFGRAAPLLRSDGLPEGVELPDDLPVDLHHRRRLVDDLCVGLDDVAVQLLSDEGRLVARGDAEGQADPRALAILLIIARAEERLVQWANGAWPPEADEQLARRIVDHWARRANA